MFIQYNFLVRPLSSIQLKIRNKPRGPAWKRCGQDGSGQLEPSELVDGYLLGKLEPGEATSAKERFLLESGSCLAPKSI